MKDGKELPCLPEVVGDSLSEEVTSIREELKAKEEPARHRKGSWKGMCTCPELENG